MDVVDYNKQAWDHPVRHGNRWTLPVGSAEIAQARMGRWSVVLTPTRRVPYETASQATFTSIRNPWRLAPNTLCSILPAST